MNFNLILEKAINGDEESIQKILKIYEPMIKSNSKWRGIMDEDLEEYIIIRIVKNISKFKNLKKFLETGLKSWKFIRI